MLFEFMRTQAAEPAFTLLPGARRDALFPMPSPAAIRPRISVGVRLEGMGTEVVDIAPCVVRYSKRASA
jgi:hypothetical protein